MTDPREYREQAAEVGDLLRAAEEAARRLAEAEERRAAAYAAVEEELARLETLDKRAVGIWRELTTRFGPQATGPLPEPAEPPPGLDAEDLLREAHRRVREPIEYPLGERYAAMAGLGFAAAAAVAALGVALAEAARAPGPVRLAVAAGTVLAGPWVGHLVAGAWVKLRTSHEERDVALRTTVAGVFGGGGVLLIGLILLMVRLVG